MQRIYLDTCCYNRPFDDQSYDIIRIESEVIEKIILLVKHEKLKLIKSAAIYFEISKSNDVNLISFITKLLEYAQENVT